MKLTNSTWIMIGVIAAVIVGIYLYSRRPKRSGLAAFFSKSQEAFQNAPATDPTEELKGNPEACKLLKNVLGTVNAQLATEQIQGNPAQLNLLTLTKKGMEEQLAKMQCA